MTHTLNTELTEKAISQLQKAGRTVNVEAARRVASAMIAEGKNFNFSGEAVESFRCAIWNYGLVK